MASQFDLAYAAAQEGYRLSIDVGYGADWHLINMAAVEAVWGRDQDARGHAGEALALGSRYGFWFQALSEWSCAQRGRPCASGTRQQSSN